MNLREQIISLIKQNTPVQVQVGKVMSLDDNEMTCDVEIEGSPERLDVRLRSVIDMKESGVLIYPKLGSYVLVALIDNNPQSSFVCGFSDIEKVRLLNCKIELNGDNHGGVVISQKVADEINAVKQDLNTIKTVFNSWVVAPGDGGAALKALATSWANNQMAPVLVSDLENKAVKHGE